MRRPRDMSCEEALQYVFDYLDHELDHVHHEDMEHHLTKCRSCFSRVEFERRLKAKLRATAHHRAPESLRARVGAMLTRY